MKKTLLFVVIAFIGTTTLANKSLPPSISSEKQFVVEAQYDWPVDNCGKTLSVTVTCTGYCDPNGNMRDAANDYVLAHWDPVQGCYIP